MSTASGRSSNHTRSVPEMPWCTILWTFAVLKEREAGILKGKRAIASFFARGFQSPENGLGRWYRTRAFFSNGRQLTWEYPRDTPQGDQVDLVEVMDLANGLIAHHRVYWGWVGFKALIATSSKPAS
jgi:steroid Delta-isomerase